MDRRHFLTFGSMVIASSAGCLGFFNADELPDDESTDDGSRGEDDDGPSGSKEKIPAILPSIRTVSDYYSNDHITYSGSADLESEPFTLDDGFTVVIFEIGDDVDIRVDLVDESVGEVVESIENVLESTEGATGAGMSAGTYHLDVEADGEWEATIVQPTPSNSDIQSVPFWLSGVEADVFGPFESNGTVTVTGDHDGTGFLVRFFGQDSTSISDSIDVFTESGSFEGSTEVEPEGVTWVTIVGTDNYQLMVE